MREDSMVRAVVFTFFTGFFAHFSRFHREKPGYPGLRYRSGLGAARRGRSAPLLSLAPQGVSRPSGGFPLRRLFAALPLFFLAGGLDAQNSFKTGEEFFLNNKPADAVSYLERAAEEDPAHVTAFLYLGMAYMQLDRVDEAVAVYLKILPRGGDETARIAYNLGNAYYVKGNTASAGQYYTQAIEADPAYASAYLNRANALVRSGALRDALPDYERYLSLEPRSEKRPQIERLTAFIREEFAAEERRRILAEEAARAEAERRRRLLEEVSASLQSAAENSKSLSSGTEEVENYEGEFELE